MSQAITQSGGAGIIPPGGSATAGDIPPSNDYVTVNVGGYTFGSWDSVSITVGMELMPSSFQVGYTALQQGEPESVIAVPGQPAVLKIGNDTILTGYIDGVGVTLAPNSHSLKMGGRGKCQDLVDCSAVIKNMVMNSPSALALATALAAPFGISVTSTVAEPADQPIPQVTINIGETPFEIIDRISRYRQLITYELPDGSLLLTKVGTTKAASGFSEGVNIESIATQFSNAQRFSEYDIYWTSNQSLSNIQEAQSNGVDGNLHGKAVDTDIPAGFNGAKRYRPKLIVSEQTNQGVDQGNARAAWEMNRRNGRAKSVSITCDSWRDSSGKLWAINTLADIYSPNAMLPAVTWLISEITFRKDDNGTHADITLMDPSAFALEPASLAGNFQVAQDLAASKAAGGAAK